MSCEDDVIGLVWIMSPLGNTLSPSPFVFTPSDHALLLSGNMRVETEKGRREDAEHR